TKPNAHGVYKVYANRPTHDPDKSLNLEQLCDTDELLPTESTASAEPKQPWYFPFKNPTTAHMIMQENLGPSGNTHAGTDAIAEMFLQDDFEKKDLIGFSSKRENDRLDRLVDTPPGEPPNGWKCGTVKLKLPCIGHCTSEDDAPEIEINNIIYRPLLDTLREALQSSTFEHFHLTPYELRWDPNHDARDPDDDMDDATTEQQLDEHGLPPLPAGHLQVFGEVYTSPRMLKAHKAFDKLPPSPKERVRVPYMFFSDATHLASFGNASIWPLYTYFG
ncbi:hypothetical protein GGX14DRAFT_296978, partial [Mycena pura]